MSAKAKAKVADQLQAIEDASRDALLVGWHQHFGQSPPKNISTLLLRRAVAYKVQERAYGGLRPQTYRYLRQVTEGKEAGAQVGAIQAPVELLPGTRLVREWNGKSYEVYVAAPKPIHYGRSGVWLPERDSPFDHRGPLVGAALLRLGQGEVQMTKPLRCAIYTRKSSEEGLEQDFNSLHAQREACEAYVKSQKHEGWQLIKTAYDDGGISGGTMQRPALQQLLADIEAKKVDIVVVYKVDRLTRALADFARMVELFDRHGVSFVSVTQQFNTTSSMGRLTLNVLLSFAQFEREVTGERIRDKIKASKTKGMFMGGRVPLGYRSENNRLLIREDEATIVRHIFQLYLDLGCATKLRKALIADGTRGRPENRKGGTPDNATFSRGALYDMLRNPVYIGKIRHKDLVHNGLHEAILDTGLWNAVQKALDDNRRCPKSPRPRKLPPNLLIGKIWDEAGQTLGTTSSNKRGQYWRYYISRRPVGYEGDMGWRIRGDRLEEIVIQAVKQVLTDAVALSRGLQAAGVVTTALSGILAEIKSHRLSPERILKEVVQSIHLQPSNMRINLNLDMLTASRDLEGKSIIIRWTTPLTIKRRGVEMRLVLPAQQAAPGQADPILVKIIAKAVCWFDDLASGKVENMKALGEREGVSSSYVGDLLKLAFLAPKIINLIMAGRQPEELVADHLIRAHDLPLDWAEQARRFNIS